MTAACIDQPVSWLRLERLALGDLDAAGATQVGAHLAACPACAAAYARITEDARPLPPLRVAVVAPPPWWRSWRWTGGGLALAVAAAVALVVVRPTRPPAVPAGAVRVKGAGLVEVTVVRERAGEIRFDPDDVAPDDRWKLQVTCAPGGRAWIDVAVYQGREVGFPLPPQPIACGNTVVVPGAFRITAGGAELCVAVTGAGPPDRARLTAGDRGGVVCRTLRAAQ
ncbi:MAG: zf-HC2 domain-containing protein [Kofleriaceae bacterium]